jgi:hypothetical protein
MKLAIKEWSTGIFPRPKAASTLLRLKHTPVQSQPPNPPTSQIQYYLPGLISQSKPLGLVHLEELAGLLLFPGEISTGIDRDRPFNSLQLYVKRVVSEYEDLAWASLSVI